MIIEELIDLLSEEESKCLVNHSSRKSRYDIAPLDSAGSPIEDSTARPTLVFDVLDEEVVLRWIYLNKQGEKLGSNIIRWFIKYCKYNNYQRMSIHLVNKENYAMRRLAEKFDFVIDNDNGDTVDYVLRFSEEM